METQDDLYKMIESFATKFCAENIEDRVGLDDYMSFHIVSDIT